ncbi:MAG TPA: ATPase, T2SS/T4P/T4SS family [Candidatus Dormibacteraeota bacterium]|nr:ATPase, T2SS/T4P/T4SS family [Candidatus Dormibacteraeota bacterium]
MAVDAAAEAIVDVEARVLGSVELQLAQRLGERGSARVGLEDQDWVYAMVGRVVAEEHRLAGLGADRDASVAMWRRVYGAVTPLGPLAEFLADPSVEEIRVNGTGTAYVLRDGRREEVPPPFPSEEALVELVHWYTDGAGSARLDRSSPMVTLTLPDGSRLHAALSPPARPLAVTIRRHVPSRFRELADLAQAGFLSAGSIPFLEAVVRSRLNVLVAGGTGTGKTTFVRTLCRLIPPTERLVTIEDQAELHLWRELPDCVSLEGRPANVEGRGAIGIPLLVHEALRMSPDRIVIGEVRGAEALDLLDAMNTGHPGSICTIHSETPRDTLPRLARLALRNAAAPRPEAISAEIARTVDLVLQLGVSTEAGLRRRRLRSIGVVTEGPQGQPEVADLAELHTLPERVAAKLGAAGYDCSALLDWRR